MLKSVVAALVFGTLVTGSLGTTSAQAQTITITKDEPGLKRFLASKGFRDVVITRRKFTSTTAEGCRGNERYRIKVRLLGNLVEETRIGTCRPRFDEKAATQAMRSDGYNDIKAGTKGDTIVATGCRENRTYQLTFNLRGDLIDRARGRRCGGTRLGLKEVRDALRKAGYNRIRFTDRELPKYVAEACDQRTKVRLELNRRGEIRTERRIGVCAAAINPKNIAAAIAEQGFKRVRVVQNRRAPYLARACKTNDRFELIVSKYGDVLSQTKLGKCREPINPANLATLLEGQGYERISRVRTNSVPYTAEACRNSDLLQLTVGRFGKVQSEKVVGRCAALASEADILAALKTRGLTVPVVKQTNGGGWRAEACDGATKVEVRFTRYGEPRDQRNVGSCRSEKVLDVLDNLRQRGAKDVTMFVQGCFQNNTYHWRFDDLGNRVDRVLAKRGC